MPTLRKPRVFNLLWQLAVGVTATGTAITSGQPILSDLGTLGGDYTEAAGISDDGRFAVGVSSEGADRAFRWSLAGGIQSLGTLGIGNHSNARATNLDGSIVVGYALEQPSGQYRAFRWTEGGGMVNLGVPAGGIASFAQGINADGSLIVGYFTVPSARAFKWTSGTGIVELAPLAGGERTRAFGASANGEIIVGWSEVGDHTERAVLWREDNPPQNLGTLPGFIQSVGQAISADGSLVAGTSYTTGPDSHAFLWSESTGPLDLGVLAGWAATDALDLSHDGQTVVGRGRTPEGIDRAFIWTSTRGLQDLAIYLDSLGVDVAGWQLQSARGISGDGTAITGTGTLDGATRGWIVRGIAPPCISIVTQPQSVVVCTTGAASYEVAAIGAQPAFQWFWRPGDMEPWASLADGVVIDPVSGTAAFQASGTMDSELAVTPVGGTWTLRSSSISFRCVVANDCGSVTSDEVRLTVCAADLNCDAQVDFIDFLAFLNLYIAQDLAADFTADGLVDFADYLEFLNLYNTGC